MSRHTLVDSLARMWERIDPVPAGLVERALVSLAVDELDLEYELLSLTERGAGLTGARGGTLTFTFDSAEVSLVLRVSSTGPDTCRVDGWITPARPMTVTAAQAGVSVEATIVDGGRFEFPELRSGATRFLVHPDTVGITLVTPAVDL
ncbi:MAG: hypothetical protein ACRCYU_12980 [Nocardioides sp.]